MSVAAPIVVPAAAALSAFAAALVERASVLAGKYASGADRAVDSGPWTPLGGDAGLATVARGAFLSE